MSVPSVSTARIAHVAHEFLVVFAKRPVHEGHKRRLFAARQWKAVGVLKWNSHA